MYEKKIRVKHLSFSIDLSKMKKESEFKFKKSFWIKSESLKFYLMGKIFSVAIKLYLTPP